jgi:serine/threonine protein phosphatase PrpC
MAVAVDVMRFADGDHLALASDGVFQNLGGRRMTQALSMAPLTRTDTLVADTVREANAKHAKAPGTVITAHDDDATLVLISRTP